MEFPSLDVIWSLTWLLIVVPAGLIPLCLILDPSLGQSLPPLHRTALAIRRIGRMSASAQDVAYLFTIDVLFAAGLATLLTGQQVLEVMLVASGAVLVAWTVAFVVPIPSLTALAIGIVILGGIIIPLAAWSGPAESALAAQPGETLTQVVEQTGAPAAAPTTGRSTASAGSPAARTAATLVIGGRAVVRTQDTLNLRQSPAGTIIGSLDPGTQVQIVDGPRTAGGYTWWNVKIGAQTGWAAQGSAGEQWLAPLP